MRRSAMYTAMGGPRESHFDGYVRLCRKMPRSGSLFASWKLANDLDGGPAEPRGKHRIVAGSPRVAGASARRLPAAGAGPRQR